MSRNLKIFAVAAVVLAVAGLMNDAAAMFILSGVCAAVILVCYLLSGLALSRVEVEMTPPARNAAAGSDLRPHVLVRSIGSIAIGSAAVEVSARNLTIEDVAVERRVLLPHLPPGSEMDADLELTPPARGRYRLSPPAIVDSDPIGMFEQRREFGEPAELIVFPRTWDLPRVATWDSGMGRLSRRGRQARRDRGEFRGIREHTPGDDLRHVHWKVTAHIGELSVKEYEPLRHDMISIQLDLAEQNHYGGGASGTLETAVSAAASLARAGLAEQRSVSLMGSGLPPEVGRPGVGQAHLHRIMVSLAEAAATPESFSESLSRQLRSVARGASVFVITTGAERHLAQVLGATRSSVGSMMLLVVEPETGGGPGHFTPTSRQVTEAAYAAGVNIGVLRSPADIGDALTAATGGMHRSEAEVI